MTWAGLCASRRLCWSADACSCGAPAAARLLSAQVWRGDARRPPRWSHESKATRGVERPQGGTAPAHRGGKHTTRGEHSTPQGENSTRGNPPANKIIHNTARQQFMKSPIFLLLLCYMINTLYTLFAQLVMYNHKCNYSGLLHTALLYILLFIKIHFTFQNAIIFI